MSLNPDVKKQDKIKFDRVTEDNHKGLTTKENLIVRAHHFNKLVKMLEEIINSDIKK